MSILYVKISDETKSYSLADTVSGVPYLAVADEKKIPIVTNTHDGINLLCREGRVAEYRTWLTTDFNSSKLSGELTSFSTTYVAGTEKIESGIGATVEASYNVYDYSYSSTTNWITYVITHTGLFLNTGFNQQKGSFVRCYFTNPISATFNRTTQKKGGNKVTSSYTTRVTNYWYIVDSWYPEEDSDWTNISYISSHLDKYRNSTVVTTLLTERDYFFAHAKNRFGVSKQSRSSTWRTNTYDSLTIAFKKLTQSITTFYTTSKSAYSGVSGGYL